MRGTIEFQNLVIGTMTLNFEKLGLQKEILVDLDG
jgi:hypothetical protein